MRLIESSRTLLAAGDLDGAARQLEEARRLGLTIKVFRTAWPAYISISGVKI
ncbi:MAG: hypothetical protein WKF37_14400 [Bryobacteraceae bacterium]